MSIKTSVAPTIHKITDPLVPQFIFEWHSLTEKVFVAEIPGRHESGEFVPSLSQRVINAVCITEHCNTHAMFYGFVQTFLRGYKKAIVDYPTLKESKAVATAERWKSNLLKGQSDG